VGYAHWIPLGTVFKAEYITVEVFYSGAASTMEIDAISINAGSFATGIHGYGGSGLLHSTPTHPTYIIKPNDTQYSELKAAHASDSAMVIASFNAGFNGTIVVWGHSVSGDDSTVTVSVSNDNSTWTTVQTVHVSSSTEVVGASAYTYGDIYVRISVSYGGLMYGASDFDVDAVYIA
jgi:hypothetical protein